jgi:peptidoglycan L-alanyl-D-glutamate endopeptidase CwlK
MSVFSERSKKALESCDHHLQILFNEVIKFRDCTVIEGHRGKERQDKLCRSGQSKLMFPNSKHNALPSCAVDVAPYRAGKGIVFDEDTCRAFGGFVLGIAAAMHMRVRWGGDWDGDGDPHDQSFNDLVHFEIIPR